MSLRIKCGLLNIQSLGNKTIEIHDLVLDEGHDILVLTETWLSSIDNARIQEMTPATYTFLHIPREDMRGGGVGILLSNSFKKIRMFATEKMESFEYMQVGCEIGGRKCIFVVVYRPPNLNANLFFDNFRRYLESLDMVSANTFICGDFNFWMEDPRARYVMEFTDLMDSFDLVNMVNAVTSTGGHMLDLVFSNKEHNLVQEVCVDEIYHLSPVHKLVSFMIPFEKEYRRTKNINF